MKWLETSKWVGGVESVCHTMVYKDRESVKVDWFIVIADVTDGQYRIFASLWHRREDLIEMSGFSWQGVKRYLRSNAAARYAQSDG